ncbi:MAG: hypothetical protein AVDCRST_MAG72-2107 [uncultured Nocardioidaceae bacterium]|uniref:Asp23/Gls24 family envelope stress response protein n=1 Tax=uncultured Nocardioidaceae bacterium TaxID=253824 RepID=A0A6J4MJ92_9ACTN|nr:MAG: hypothetical protein AVDCRST_MAG72-2107 [uncultured Nocardioidaceae bacterium]
MAMSHDDGVTSNEPGTAEMTAVQVASLSLREHVDDRWVEISDSILSRVLSATRPSLPVRGDAGIESFHVSESVLRAYLLDATDAVAGAAVQAISFQTRGTEYAGVAIVIAAQHGLPLLHLADELRQVVSRRLVEVLGERVPVTVSTMRVHVDDVTREDPKLG